MNTTDSPPPACPRCGRSLLADAPEGLCPRCLAAINLETGSLVTGASASLPPPPIEEIAPHFPQLEILSCLGRGGMGVVYKARQITLDRLVALKLLAPEREKDPQFSDRFAREAQALAKLSNPNIVTVYDFGQAGGFFFLLMEYVDGANPRTLLQAHKFTPEQALAIIPPLCDALQYAHDRGIVHRDIKPENLLMDREGRVKVADFGLAKMLGADPDEDENSVGTPSYMAPEQVADPAHVDNRADIYSLGVVFYEMLTGELPGKRLEAPSRKVQIDVRLDAVVLRALEKEPELRYQQAIVLKTDVETVAQATRRSPAESGQPTPVHAVWLRWIARGLAVLGFGFAMMFILAEGIPAFWKQPAPVRFELAGMVAMLVGLLVGWASECWGAALIFGGWLVFFFVERGRPPWPFTCFLIVAALYGSGWWQRRPRLRSARTRFVLAASALIAAAAFLGFWGYASIRSRQIQKTLDSQAALTATFANRIRTRLAEVGMNAQFLRFDWSADGFWGTVSAENIRAADKPVAEKARIHLFDRGGGNWQVQGEGVLGKVVFSVRDIALAKPGADAFGTMSPGAYPVWTLTRASGGDSVAVPDLMALLPMIRRMPEYAAWLKVRGIETLYLTTRGDYRFEAHLGGRTASNEDLIMELVLFRPDRTRLAKAMPGCPESLRGDTTIYDASGEKPVFTVEFENRGGQRAPVRLRTHPGAPQERALRVDPGGAVQDRVDALVVPSELSKIDPMPRPSP